MGKDLKGKELGKGLGQRKDKYYYAKYSYHGKKGQQSFHTLVEAKNWRQEQLYLCRHPELRTATSPDMTVDAYRFYAVARCQTYGLPDDPECHGERLRWFYHPSNLYDDGHIFQECQR